jgi:hypothetical protein
MDGTELGATVAIALWPVSGSDDGLVIWVELLLHAMADYRTTTKNAGGGKRDAHLILLAESHVRRQAGRSAFS